MKFDAAKRAEALKKAVAEKAKGNSMSEFKDNHIFSLGEGVKKVRVVPNLLSEDFLPCIELRVHWNLPDGACLSSTMFDEPDPIDSFISSIWKENEELARAYSNAIGSKSEFYFPVLLRGKESEGVKLMKVNKTTKDLIETQFMSEEYIDIDDVVNGRDLKFTGTKKSKNGFDFAEQSLIVSPKVTPALPAELED